MELDLSTSSIPTSTESTNTETQMASLEDEGGVGLLGGVGGSDSLDYDFISCILLLGILLIFLFDFFRKLQAKKGI